MADDERIARRGLRRLIETDPQIEVCGECCNGSEVVQALRDDPPDLLFLDIQMPLANGLDCLRALEGKPAPVTVIVSAHPQYALGAFEAQAIDYVLKPFDDARLLSALARAKRQLALSISQPSNPQRQSYAQRVAVRTERGVRIVAVADIDWIEADDYESKLHVSGRPLRVRESLAAFEARLDPFQFVRVHRSALVNLGQVVEVQPYFHGRHVLLLARGARLILARARRRQFELILGHSI